MMIGGICENPLTIRALVGWRDALRRRQDAVARHHRSRRHLRQRRASSGRSRKRPSAAPEAAVASEPAPDEAAAETETELAEIEPELAAEEGEGEESSISLAAMEAQLKPGVLAIFESIAELHKKLHRLQEQRINALSKASRCPR